ncbi:hypothetical protein AAEX37_02230 [Oligella sp. MSHR50489EDL]|uniref:AAA family ATPase n=1 Tax=Oligella sp. MSHR50489EDL TaxID=3139409 RepID=UPI003D814E8A
MEFNVHIQELGKIKDLNLAIKPLTVISGENSSGKTFATKSIYCVFEALNQNHLLRAFVEQAESFMNSIRHYERSLGERISQFDGESLINFNVSFQAISNEVSECLSKASLLEYSSLGEQLEMQQECLLTLVKDIQNYLSKRGEVAKIKRNAHFLNEAISDLKKISDLLSNSRQAIIDYIAKTLNDNFKANYQVTRLSALVNSGKSDGASIKIQNIGELKFTQKDRIIFSFEQMGIDQIQKIEHVVFIDSPVYLRIRHGLQKFSMRRFFTSRELKGYPEYIDNLYEFVDRKHMDPPTEEFVKLSLELQETILGKLSVNEAGEIQYHDESGAVTPLSLAATGVSNLGLIDLLIHNNVIKKGSFLIIDEPESHIHPKWQVKLMEVLFKMARLGVNVIIATHSLDMLKKLQLIAKQEPDANEIISVQRMPASLLDKEAGLLDKIEESLNDLSTPYYEMYMEENA